MTDDDLTPEQAALLDIDKRLLRVEKAIRDMVEIMRGDAKKNAS